MRLHEDSFLQEYMKKETVELIIIGMPKNWDESDTHGTGPAKKAVALLKKHFPLMPLKEVDERYTSKMAKNAMLEMGASKPWPDALKAFTTKHKMNWPQFFDGAGWKNKIGTEFGIRSIPAMWLVDKQGNLRDLEARNDLASKVEKLLGEP